MSEKKFSGNFYGTGKVEETPDQCPNCLYQKKDVEEDLDECPNCHYIPNKEKEKEQ